MKVSIREGPREVHPEREGGTTDNKRKIDSEEDERNGRVFKVFKVGMGPKKVDKDENLRRLVATELGTGETKTKKN